MQAWYDAAFDREMGCTEADLRSVLPGALRDATLRWSASGVEADFSASDRAGSNAKPVTGGRLTLHWSTLPPRRIALMSMPRLAVSFRFDGLADADRQRVMRYFDLYTQRGGG